VECRYTSPCCGSQFHSLVGKEYFLGAAVARIPGQKRQRRWEVKELWCMIGSTFLYSFQYIISYKLRLLISSGTLEEAPERWLTRMQTLKLRFCYSPL
jgi:hypothetical protein